MVLMPRFSKRSIGLTLVAGLVLPALALAQESGARSIGKRELAAIQRATLVPIGEKASESHLRDGKLDKASYQSFVLISNVDPSSLQVLRFLLANDPMLADPAVALQFLREDPKARELLGAEPVVVGGATISCEGTCGGGCGVSGCELRKVEESYICSPCSCIPPLPQPDPPITCPACVCKKTHTVTIDGNSWYSSPDLDRALERAQARQPMSDLP